MDFGEYIIPGIIIVSSIIGAINKKKKRESNNQASSPKVSVFEQLFSEEKSGDDFFSQTDSNDSKIVFDDVESAPMFEENSRYREQVEPSRTIFQDDFSDEPSDKELVTVTVPKVKTVNSPKAKKKNSILKELHKPNGMKKAVIYAEILKPKY